MVKDCEKLNKKKEKDAQQGKSTQKKTYPECGTCGKKNHPEERCCQGAGAHLKPKRTRPEDSTDNKPNPKAQKPQNKQTSSSPQSSSSNDESKKLTSPRLQYNELISVRQYIRSDPPTQTFHQYNQQLMGYPSVVWQQQMEKATIITYNNTHLFPKPIPVWDPDYTTTFTTRFRPIPLIDDYNPTYIDPDYGRDPYWDTEIYNQDLLQFQYALDDIEHYNKTVHENPPITHNKKTRALIENWQMNDGTNHPVFLNPLGTENPETTAESIPQSLLDEKQFQNVLITKDGEPDCIPLSTNINLKCKKRMLYFPMDFGELTIDGLIDTGALSSAIPEMDLRKIRLLSPQSVIREGPPPNFQIMVANGQLETPKNTIELKFEVGDIEFHEIFIVTEHLTGPIIGLMFLQRNHTVLDMRQGILNFPFFSMQLKTADHKYFNVLEPILNPTEITIFTREREGSLNSNLPRRSRSFASNESENEYGNMGRNRRNINSRTNTECDRNSVTGNSSAEINRLSSELNSRISREMDEMMNSVSAQIQRAISDAISTQVLPQIQKVIMAGSGHGTRKGWGAPSERPELISEVQRNLNAKKLEK